MQLTSGRLSGGLGTSLLGLGSSGLCGGLGGRLGTGLLRLGSGRLCGRLCRGRDRGNKRQGVRRKERQGAQHCK
jgi:hypothetical protein